ncbi:S-adenosyl-L-methionine-dependent methyltransferases superfamily protein [Rhynchospora pubera]|uniref:S-adenosyl-L-methionine-dependent methyltransferases superfamily protein n=1 Tax=Rhynchospora pubera TaxID=906938 RepID=A0AAV8GIE8_9POAL|nr:S-adenosyl-L-methionine-dependent methyltransferases superfamily protein [Rhynchospora pubera]
MGTATALHLSPLLPRFYNNPSRFNAKAHLPVPHARLSPLRLGPARSSPDGQSAASAPVAAETKEEEPFSVIMALSTKYNDGIMVIDSPCSRYLLLDSSRNVHSMIKKDSVWTGSYWDEFASLPAIIPQGPIAMLGLGAGTAAHSILKYYPSFHIIGWELDELLINVARAYFDLSKVEEKNEHGGYLSVCIGDALSPDATVEGGFAGIIVDLFADGKILPQLLEEETWAGLAKKLMPNGRIMVNCSGRDNDQYYREHKIAPPKSKRSWTENSAIKALSRALPGEVCWKLVEEPDCENYFALTGPLPDLDAWSMAVPAKLSPKVKLWQQVE